MCASTLLLYFFYVHYIITITIESEADVPIRNRTNSIAISEIIQELSKDGDIIILSKREPPISMNETVIPSDDDSETDSDFEDLDPYVQEEIQSPQMKHILRWLPKRYHFKKQKVLQQIARNQAIEKNRQMANAQNIAQMKYVVEMMQKSYWTTLYLYGEVQRILKDRVVYDDVREMIQVLERLENIGLKRNVLECYRNAKRQTSDAFWKDKKTNNLVIHHVQNPDNHGVMTK